MGKCTNQRNKLQHENEGIKNSLKKKKYFSLKKRRPDELFCMQIIYLN
jgi:hypothetical protein